MFSQARQATLLSSFLTALTRGGPSGLPRPIELHAHDPLRYVGDMLAWVHQAIAAERELLESLFGLTGDGRMVGSVRVSNTDSEEEEWIRELMDACVGKLCTPLKVVSHVNLAANTLNHAIDPCAPDSAIPGKQHHFVQNCQPVTVLFDYNAPNHRGERPIIDDSVRVGDDRVP